MKKLLLSIFLIATLCGMAYGDDYSLNGVFHLVSLEEDLDANTFDISNIGILTVNTALFPNASGGADIGSATFEWGDVYIATDKQINFGDGQEFNLKHESANLHLGIHDTAGNEFMTWEDLGSITAANLFGMLDIHRTAGNAVSTSFEGLGVHMDVEALDASSTFHAMIIDATGSTTGEVIAFGIFPGVEVLIQHTGSFVTPDQGPGVGTYAGRLVDPDNTAVFTAGVDGQTLYVTNDDEIYIGSATTFTQLRIILTTPGSKSIGQPPNDIGEYYFRNTGNTWTQFFPTDSSDGFSMNGISSWDATDLSSWKSDYDPFTTATATGYWIKIRRTRNNLSTTPVPTTVEILDPTNFGWDENGDLIVNGASFNDALDYDDPTVFTTTLTGFHAGNQTQTADITSLPGNNVTSTLIECYLNGDPGADENQPFRFSLHSKDTYLVTDEIWSDYSQMTYTETNGGVSSTDTTDTVDDASGLVKFDTVRYLGGTAEFIGLTAAPTATGLTFDPLAEAHSDNTGIVKVFRAKVERALRDADGTSELHLKVVNLGDALTGSTAMVCNISIR